MELFIIRHAEAVPRGSGRDDARRALTGRGRERWRESVEGLRALKVGFDRLLHGASLRVIETAEAATRLLEGDCLVTQGLAAAPGQGLLAELVGRRVAVVGQEPRVSELIGWLVVGDSSAGPRFVLERGGVAWLEGAPLPGQMKLRALFTPRALHRLGARR